MHRQHRWMTIIRKGQWINKQSLFRGSDKATTSGADVVPQWFASIICAVATTGTSFQAPPAKQSTRHKALLGTLIASIKMKACKQLRARRDPQSIDDAKEPEGSLRGAGTSIFLLWTQQILRTYLRFSQLKSIEREKGRKEERKKRREIPEEKVLLLGRNLPSLQPEPELEPAA
ncbi:hypothetical protein AXG93_1504s1290 [Marchantia polymorpha subsp. ruderalis]|uniref:Uncharacterized protein n=1 Tax=Marchantia polymorpha subsp. ruderalis TaxID=1480154 RepID=A0A176VMZ2_MARPO|nr:hypothetical protein AXG93_1504s1290 [Marchantia polymorpha subsp. ruderalis]